jgi:hypothetical protein
VTDALSVAFLAVAGLGAIGIFLPMPAIGIKTRWRGFLICCLGGLAAVAFTRQPHQATTPIASAPLSPLDAFQQRVSDEVRAPIHASQDGYALTVTFTVPDNLTQSLMAGSARTAIAAMGRDALDLGLAFTSMTVDAYAAMTDVYGNTTNERVIHAVYSRSTLAKVNWRNFNNGNVFLIADSSNVWPQFR